MEISDISAWVRNPWAWGALALACFGGVWWYKMTASTSNLTVIGGIFFAAVMVWFFPWVSSQPPTMRFLFTMLAAISIAIAQFYLGLWSDAPGTVSNGAKPKKQKQPFVMDYLPGNCSFLTVEDNTKSKLNGRKALLVNDFKIVNNTDSITTLKSVTLAYEQGPKKQEISGLVFPVGTLKNGEFALMLLVP
jgi:hypothetical protein